MTDNEIIKALECCCEAELKTDCIELKCPFFDYEINNCMNVDDEDEMLRLVLDLINRQKAEIERLHSILLSFTDEVHTWSNKKGYDTTELSLIPILNEERGIKENIKAEAIKEFAENLRKHYDQYDDYDDIYVNHIRDDIDFLLDEMAGDIGA